MSIIIILNNIDWKGWKKVGIKVAWELDFLKELKNMCPVLKKQL